MTLADCGMARVALNVSTRTVAEATRLGINTVTRFENRAGVRVSSADRLREYIEAAGVEFVGVNGGGPDVRLKV